jgi:hypothetical protein
MNKKVFAFLLLIPLSIIAVFIHYGIHKHPINETVIQLETIEDISGDENDDIDLE